MMNPAPSNNSVIYKIKGVGYYESRTFSLFMYFGIFQTPKKVRDE